MVCVAAEINAHAYIHLLDCIQPMEVFVWEMGFVYLSRWGVAWVCDCIECSGGKRRYSVTVVRL